MSTATKTGFSQLLDALGDDPDTAAENYEILRLKIIKCLTWKGCPESEADELADIVFDRISAKLLNGERIKNVNAFARSAMKFVYLERLRRRRETVTDDGDMPDIAVPPEIGLLKDSDERLQCLRTCLTNVVPNERDRNLILTYYDNDFGKSKDVRKSLAGHLGISMTALKVKACRLRDRLERCINKCVGLSA